MTPKYIIIHCSATAEGKDFKAKDIDRWHKQRGFKKIGYHYVIDLDGTVEKGRNDNEVGAQAIGYNDKSLGVVYIGGLDKDGKTPKDTRTEAQKQSMLKLVKELISKYNIPVKNVIGHRETSKDLNGDGVISPNEWIKACPSFEVADFRKELEEKPIDNIKLHSKIIGDLFLKSVQNDINNLGK